MIQGRETIEDGLVLDDAFAVDGSAGLGPDAGARRACATGTYRRPAAPVRFGHLAAACRRRAAGVVAMGLDAGTAVLYRQINRPHPEVTFERLVECMIAFRQEYSGKIWIEVMLVQGLSDTEAALHEIAAKLRAHHVEMVRLLTQEEGKPIPENEEELWWTEETFDYYAELGRHERGQVIPPGEPTQFNFTLKEPWGVVA